MPLNFPGRAVLVFVLYSSLAFIKLDLACSLAVLSAPEALITHSTLPVHDLTSAHALTLPVLQLQLLSPVHAVRHEEGQRTDQTLNPDRYQNQIIVTRKKKQEG